MRATAYTGQGRTASGKQVRRGMVAADRRVLPLGTKVRVKNAGRYSGVYRVEDTGGAIRGHKIDIYMPSRDAAKQFGRQTVKVEVLKPQTKRRRQGFWSSLLFWRREIPAAAAVSSYRFSHKVPHLSWAIRSPLLVYPVIGTLPAT